MSRAPRIDIAGIPQHIIQRGNNRNACFFTGNDYRYYLGSLKKAADKCRCSIHAYVLMTNHVHLLATGAGAGSVSKMMQSIGRRYVRHVNAVHKRTGTLWEGRFKSSLVDTDLYLLTCYRYIELNPVRASLVDTPAAYRWSSYAYNALGRKDDVLSPHERYMALGRASAGRCSAYLRLFPKAINDDELVAIRNHVNQGKVLGAPGFQEKVERSLGCRARLSKQGRPKKVL